MIELQEEEVVFTEYNLETQNQDEEPVEKRNIMEKSFILAPYCSYMNLNDTLEQEPELVPRSVLKFSKKVREINRQYE